MAQFIGTSGDDTQPGTVDADLFDYSQGGNDTLTGLEGDDHFLLGASLTAADSIDGGAGNDLLNLDGGYNLIFGAATIANIETLKLGGGHSYALVLNDANVAAGATLTVNGADLGTTDTLSFTVSDLDSAFDVTGGDGNDILGGSSGNDSLTGRDGDDQLNGGGGVNTLAGNNGDDTLDNSAGAGGGALSGGGGNDIIFTSNLAATALADAVDAGADDDRVTVNGGTFADGTLLGGGGTDTLNLFGSVVLAMPIFSAAQSGFETLNVGEGRTVDGDDTENVLDFSGFATTDPHLLKVDAGHGKDTVTAWAANAVDFFGGPGDDMLTGSDKGDTIDGGANDDFILANRGGDVLFGGTGGNDTILAGAGNDHLTGGSGLNNMYGGAGDDVLDNTGGGAGSLLVGGLGNDSFAGGGDAARYLGAAGDDNVQAGIANDTLEGGRGNDTLNGSDGDDKIIGGGGDDTIHGGAGRDLLAGRTGADTFVFDALTDSANATPDRIRDFADDDTIDLSGIDADISTPGDDAFTLVAAFDGHAGQAFLDVRAHVTWLELDVDGDAVTDSTIILKGTHSDILNFVG